jgi:5'-nucleotidase (lipoprotein e(P4) family)
MNVFQTYGVLLLTCAFLSLNTSCTTTPTNEYQEGAVVWFQRGSETKALQYMAYNVAKDRLSQLLKSHKKKDRPMAVVLDLDETVINNSYYQVDGILKNKSYPEGWTEWVLMEKATLIAGAQEFLDFAHQAGVEIFYVTNRKKAEEMATINNLVKLRLPIKEENLFVRTKESSKMARRGSISEKYNVVLLIGDNLNDFSEIFEQKNMTDRDQLVVDQKDSFGRKWIVLPNPIYGDWESAVHNYNHNKLPEEKSQDRKKAMIGIEDL